MKVTIVKDDENFMGVEIEAGKGTFFISANQDLWPGIRLGKFPPRQDGTEFERVESIREKDGQVSVVSDSGVITLNADRPILKGGRFNT